MLASTIAAKTADQDQQIDEKAKRRASQEELAKISEATKQRAEKEKAEYDATVADLTKGILSLRKAIDSMESTTPTSMLQTGLLATARDAAEMGLRTAQAMGLVPETSKETIGSFVQSGLDPNSPEYRYHSQNIIDLLKKLLDEFVQRKSDTDSDWEKARLNYSDTLRTLKNQMSTNQQAIDSLKESIDELTMKIASDKEDLIRTEALLKDDQRYLKDLTTSCETRAQSWDQRSQLRGGELQALSEALTIMKGRATHMDSQVNMRALLQRNHGDNVSPTDKGAGLVQVSKHNVVVALLQEGLKTNAAARRLLRGSRITSLNTDQDKVAKARSFLETEGRRLNSATLSVIAMHANDNPFDKVKSLIQSLIERLLTEATNEATKKGWCDTEVAKATDEMKYRTEEMKKLKAEIESHSANLAVLEEEIDLLTKSTAQLETSLDESTQERDEEMKINTETIQKANEGKIAVEEAIKILSDFYAGASKAVFLQASPVDEDFAPVKDDIAGVYKGKQTASTGIIGLLMVIKSDFERTIRVSKANEKQAHREFVKFNRTSRADISGQEMKTKLDTEDARTTLAVKEEKEGDLDTAKALHKIA